MSVDSESRRGAIYAGAAFFCWGIIPIYFNEVRHIPVTEIIGHRVLGVCLLSMCLLTGIRMLPALKQAWRTPGVVRNLAISAFMISTNWLVFTWAVTHDRLLATSMGYFINPLFSVMMGVVLLGERLRLLQKVSVLLAAAGVALLVVAEGRLPWISLYLPLTFGVYGLIRKQTPVHALVGLSIETTLMFPLALAYLGALVLNGSDHVVHAAQPRDYLVLLSGPFTLIPLTLFSAGARRITLTTLGFLQYLTPSMTFFLGVFVYHEPFSRVQLVTFVFIWVSLAIFSVDGVRANRAALPPVAQEGA